MAYPAFWEGKGSRRHRAPAQPPSLILLRKQSLGPRGPARGLQEEALEKQSSYFHFFWTRSGVTASQFPPKTHSGFVFCLPSVRSGKGERAFLSLGDALELSAGLRCPSWGRGWEDMGQGALAPSVIWGPGVLSSAAGLTCEDKGTTRLAATTLCLRARLPAGARSFVLRVLFLGREQRCSQAAAARRTRR